MSGVLHSLACSLLLLLYIPYCLYWSPVRHQLTSDQISAQQIDWRIFDKTVVILLLFLLITDFFLIVGVMKEHK